MNERGRDEGLMLEVTKRMGGILICALGHLWLAGRWDPHVAQLVTLDGADMLELVEEISRQIHGGAAFPTGEDVEEWLEG